MVLTVEKNWKTSHSSYQNNILHFHNILDIPDIVLFLFFFQKCANQGKQCDSEAMPQLNDLRRHILVHLNFHYGSHTEPFPQCVQQQFITATHSLLLSSAPGARGVGVGSDNVDLALLQHIHKKSVTELQ